MYIYAIECPYAQLLLEKILTSYSPKTKLNLINVQMQPKRDTTFILPCMLKYNDK